MKIPPPQTWAEGQRGVMSWLMAAAGMFCGVTSVCVVLILWAGGWPNETADHRLTIIAIGFVGFLLGMVAVILALAVGGPVGRFKGAVGKDGGSFELEGDEALRDGDSVTLQKDGQ